MSGALLSIGEVAARLRMTRRAVYYRLKTGKLTVASRTPDGSIRIDAETLKAAGAKRPRRFGRVWTEVP